MCVNLAMSSCLAPLILALGLSACVPSHQRVGTTVAVSDQGSVVTGGELSFGYSELGEKERNGLFGIDGTSMFFGFNASGGYDLDRGITGELCPLTFGFYGVPGTKPRYHARARVVCVGAANDDRSKRQIFLAAELQAGPTLSLFQTSRTDHTLDLGFFVRRQQGLDSGSGVSAWLFGVGTYWSGSSDALLDFDSPRNQNEAP